MSTESSSKSVATGATSSSSIKSKINILYEANQVVERRGATNHVRSFYRLYKLENPQGSSPINAILDIYGDTPDDRKSIRIMMNLNHVNILKCYQYQKCTADSSVIYELLTEDITGSLRNVLDNKFYTFHIGFYFPSAILIKLVRSIMDVLKFLHKKGEYHGALSFETLPYVDNNGTIVVKFTNFVEKHGISTKQAQLEDWHDLGAMIDAIFWKVYPNQDMHTNSLSYVANYFQTLTLNQVKTIEERLHEETDFFWRVNDRRRFAMHVSLWCKDSTTRDILRTHHSNIVKLPWDGFSVYPTLGQRLLDAMNNYRMNNKKLEYDVNCIIEFIRFMSGIYTHCNSILSDKNLSELDKFIVSEYRDIFQELRRIKAQEGFM